MAHQAGDKTFTVHLDGFNMLPYLAGEVKDSPRNSFFYFSDDGDLLAIRMNDWKLVLMEQRAKQLMAWLEPFVPLRAPKMFHLRRDPFERADENSNTYWDWMISHIYLMYEMQGLVAATDPGLHPVPAASETGFIQSGGRDAAAGRNAQQQRALNRITVQCRGAAHENRRTPAGPNKNGALDVRSHR